MKRKWNSDAMDEDPQLCDLILTDASGRSVRVSKALLIDKSDYFAKILCENKLDQLHLDENYLVDLIHYLFSQERETDEYSDNQAVRVYPSSHAYENGSPDNSSDAIINNSDIEILMQLLALCKKYGFNQLYRKIISEINYKIQPSSVINVYKCATDLQLDELRQATKFMILSWLPQVQTTSAYHNLPESAIIEIFEAESPDIDNECKLNALSVWWARNTDADMTSLWVKLITCEDKGS